MCGFAGIVSREGNGGAGAVMQGARSLRHRGPDAEKEWMNDDRSVTLGHQRLCVIDLSDSAAQPMHYANRYTLVFNGEIYNYLELKGELERTGHIFQSRSDTEVILAAFAAWGEDCLQRFDGAFAFALWDEQEKTLFAARDRLGEKPFFFSFGDERLVFASEIKALWEMGVPADVNGGLLYNFLTLGYTVNPTDAGETFYQHVRKLPAAHCLTYGVRSGELHSRCYWQVYPGETRNLSDADAVAGFSDLFSESFHRRLRSDVAIGTSLSGGLDSSAIVAFCAGERAAQYTHKCFTASFEGFEKNEQSQASLVAKRFGLAHFTATIGAAEVPALMDAVCRQQDEPFSSSSALAQYAVCRVAREQGVTVLLDGQGADELLAGYHKYYRHYWTELYRSRRLGSSGELEQARQLGVREGFGHRHKLAALLPDFATSLVYAQKSKAAFRHPDLDREFAFRHKQDFAYTAPLHPGLNGALFYNTFVNGLEELLRLADRNSMAHSVEVRLPFLSHRLVEFLFSLPPSLKIRDGWTKWLLRKAVDKKLPDEIVWRRDKVGFETPQVAWMQNDAVKERIMTARKTLVEQGVLNAGVLQKSVVPRPAHDAQSLDWRYWSAAHLFAPKPLSLQP